MGIVLYSTNCPKCKVLETKMTNLGIDFQVFNNIDDIIKLGFQQAPMVKDEQGKIMNFSEAIKWLKTLEV